MPHQNHFLHPHLSKKQEKNIFDRTVLVASFLYPISGVPQVIEVFQGNVEGVSIASWVCFFAFSLLFFVYGIVYRIKPMIINYFLWLLVELAVVIGVLSQ